MKIVKKIEMYRNKWRYLIKDICTVCKDVVALNVSIYTQDVNVNINVKMQCTLK